MGKLTQKIFFGPPGCGKSYRVRQEAESKLGIKKGSSYMIETAFHPEYGYGDFVAKLLPKTEGGSIQYHIYTGPLIKALARAYAELNREILLVIDEINRGNCAQIFGDIFQLLDRDAEGWSEYGIDPSDLIMEALKKELAKLEESPDRNQVLKKIEETLKHLPVKLTDAESFKLRLPPNLSLIGTMNTSDESVYYMDTAFKRRWDFEYMQWDGMVETSDSQNNTMIKSQKDAKIKIAGTVLTWHDFLKNLNAFIADEFKGRNVDDKQVGIWFLKASNLPQLATRANRIIKIVLSEKQANLVIELLQLRNQSKGWDHWSQYFKVADLDKLKTALQEDYQIDCIGLDFTRDIKYFPANLVEQILKKKPTRIEIEESICASESAEEVGKGTGESEVTIGDIKNKLMFFLWDNVFSRSRLPLCGLLEKEVKTFGDFSSEENSIIFIEKVKTWSLATKSK